MIEEILNADGFRFQLNRTIQFLQKILHQLFNCPSHTLKVNSFVMKEYLRISRQKSFPCYAMPKKMSHHLFILIILMVLLLILPDSLIKQDAFLGSCLTQS